ncbi:MAG: hypothetical protein Q7S21_01085 [archaeon]|nr:hypothetical protein [archaeon]
MKQKNATTKPVYSKKQIAKLMALCEKLEKFQKQPGFRKAAREFVKLTT